MIEMGAYNSMWYDASSYTIGFGAVNLNAATPNDVRKSLFIVDPSLGSVFNPSFPTNSSLPPYVNNSGWFNFQLGGTTYSCGNMSNCHEYDLVLDEGSPSLLAMIALDSVLSVDFVEESQSIAQSVLYERLRSDSSLASGNVVYQYFLNNEPVLYNLYEARTRMQESREVEDSLANLLLSLQEAMQQTEDTIRYLNQLNKLNRDTIIDTLRASLLIMRTTYVSLVNQLKTTNNALLAEAGFYNSLVTNPGELPQQNEHFLNEVELDYETSGIDSIQNRYDQLVEIANQCPAQGGMSVYRARYYISLFNDSIEYDDDAVCLTQGIMRYASNPEKKLPPCIQVTPNPSKDEIEVTWNRVEMQQATITIFSVERKKILEQSIQKNTTIINISSLVPGVYIVEGCANGNPVCKVKIAVIR